MTKPIRIDWPGLLERIEAAGDDPAAFCIMCVPIGGRHLVYSIMELLRYEATYRVNDYDYSDWTYLMDIVDDTEEGIMASCDEVLNAITTAISNQSIIIQASSDACCFLESGLPAIDPPAETHPPGGSGGIPSAASLCISAQKAHDEGRNFLEDILNYAAAGGAITAGYISFAIAAYALSVPLALIATIAIAIAAIVSDLLADDALQAWDDLKADLVCAMYTSATAEAAKAQIDGAINGADVPDFFKTLFKSIYSQAQINKIWTYDVGDTTGYTEDYCESCPGGTPFWLSFTFDTDQQGFTFSNASYNGTDDCINLAVHETGGNSYCVTGYTNIKNLVGFPTGSNMTIDRIECDFIGNSNLEGTALAFIVRSVGTTSVSPEYPITAGVTTRVVFVPEELWNTGNANTAQFLGIRNGSSDPSFIMVDNVLLHGRYIEP